MIDQTQRTPGPCKLCNAGSKALYDSGWEDGELAIRATVEGWRDEAEATIEELHEASNTGAFKVRIDKISSRVAAYNHVLNSLPAPALSTR